LWQTRRVLFAVYPRRQGSKTRNKWVYELRSTHKWPWLLLKSSILCKGIFGLKKKLLGTFITGVFLKNLSISDG
jgi:hypothetical protein